MNTAASSYSQPPAAGEAAHTPTPFKASRLSEDPRFLPGQARRNIVEIEGHPDFNNGFAIADCYGPQAEANAAFIVTACNAYESLVQENARARESYEGMNHSYQQICDDHEKLISIKMALVKALQALLNDSPAGGDSYDQARAALKAATS